MKNLVDKQEKYKQKLERVQRRKQRKGENNQNKYRTRKIRNAPRCTDCGGKETWCEICEMYSQNCCIEYGTCECS